MIEKGNKLLMIGIALALVGGGNLSIKAEGVYVTESSIAWPSDEGQEDAQVEEIYPVLEEVLEEAYSDYTYYLQVGNQVLSPKTLGEKEIEVGGLSPLLVALAFFQKVEEGTLKVEDTLHLTPEMIEEKGVLSNLPLNQDYSLMTILQLLVQSDDLDAYRLMIEQVGGLESLNQALKGIGLTKTHIKSQGDMNNPWEGNVSTLEELASALEKLEAGELYSDQVSRTAKIILSQHGPILLATYAPEGQPLLGHGEESDAKGREVDLLLTQNAQHQNIIIALVGQLKEGKTSPMEEVSRLVLGGE